MNVSNTGLAFLLDWEGFRAYLYDDGGKRGSGNATVGIGILVHLGPYHDRGVCAACDEWPRNSEPKSTWLTPKQGMQLLSDKANATGRFVGGQNYVGAVRKGFPTGINQNQFDAMVSYSYNYGSGAVGRMATAFYAGKDMYSAFTDERYLRPLWAREGLLRRRKAEYGLWSTADNGDATFPQPEEDEMKVAAWWSPRTLQEGPTGTINLFQDFGPGKVYDMRLVMAPDNTGSITFRHGQHPMTNAGIGNLSQRAPSFLLIAGQYGTAEFDVKGTVKIASLACAGVIP